MSACQAIEFRRPLKSSKLLEFAHAHVREHVEFAKEDRIFADDIQKIKLFVSDGSLVKKLDEFSNSTLNKEFPEFAF
jgi:histidine ammonia-lyase